MPTHLESLRDRAEMDYLQSEDLQQFCQQTQALAERVALYEALRDRELAIFTAVVQQLQEAGSEASQQAQEQGLRHWVLILRYGALSMVLEQPQILQQLLQDWLARVVAAHQLGELCATLYPLLAHTLKQQLSADQFAYLEPYLAIAHQALTPATPRAAIAS